jgi:hypothetical protein
MAKAVRPARESHLPKTVNALGRKMQLQIVNHVSNDVIHGTATSGRTMFGVPAGGGEGG